MGGAVGLSFVAVVVVLVAAVSFLGTSSEPRFERIDLATTTPEDPGPWEDDPSLDDDPYGGGDPFADPSAAVLDDVTDILSADDWFTTGQHRMGRHDRVTSAPCAPEGWQTGVLDRAIGMFALPDDSSRDDPLTVVLATYETAAAADADLERARSPAYQECEVQQRQEIGRLGPDAEVTVLADDPAAPGVAIAMTEVGGEARTEYDSVIVVGRMRAQLDVCDCADFDLLYLSWVAADVAAAMAEQQGLPTPG